MPFKKLLKSPAKFWPSSQGFGKSTRYTSRLSYDELVNAESELGRTIFGPVPEGRTREFFMSRENLWIWHETYTDAAGVAQDMTICYDVRPDGVYKKHFGGTYAKIEGAELDNFRRAANRYFELVKNKLYN